MELPTREFNERQFVGKYPNVARFIEHSDGACGFTRSLGDPVVIPAYLCGLLQFMEQELAKLDSCAFELLASGEPQERAWVYEENHGLIAADALMAHLAIMHNWL